ncbi:MAG: dienelactone hydrolase family protein [Acidimicrobiia bacterium]
MALLYAAEHRAVRAVALCYAPLSGEDRRATFRILPDVTVPLLGLYGREDDMTGPKEVQEAQRLASQGEWILYERVGHDFLNDTRPGYDEGAADDAYDAAGDVLPGPSPRRPDSAGRLSGKRWVVVHLFGG